MKNKRFPSSWKDEAVTAYEQTIPHKIAGYPLLYDMTSRLMKVALNCEQSAAELLIVGAGGGQELVTLGQFYKQWRFTAIDSSQPMLEIAKRRMEEVRVSERVRLVEGTLEQFSAPFLYDGGTCLLVLHFIKELAEKRHFLR